MKNCQAHTIFSPFFRFLFRWLSFFREILNLLLFQLLVRMWITQEFWRKGSEGFGVVIVQRLLLAPMRNSCFKFSEALAQTSGIFVQPANNNSNIRFSLMAKQRLIQVGTSQKESGTKKESLILYSHTHSPQDSNEWERSVHLFIIFVSQSKKFKLEYRRYLSFNYLKYKAKMQNIKQHISYACHKLK